MDKILDRINAAEKYHSGRIASLKKKRSYFTLNYSFYIPPEFKVFASRSIVPATKVDKTANQIIVDIPRFDITLPQGYRETDEIRRDKQLYALKLLWHEGQMQNKIPPEQDASIHVAGYGEFCFSIWWNEDAYENGEWPFILRSHNPETIYPITDSEYVEIYTCKIADLEEMMELYNTGKKKILDYDRKGRSLDTSVKIQKYYSHTQRAFYVDGKPMFVKGSQELYQRVCPYVWGVSGWAGSSPEGKPEEESRGINDLCFAAYDDQSFVQTGVKAKMAKDIKGKYKILKDSEVDTGENLFDDVIVDDMSNYVPVEQTSIDKSAYDYMSMLSQQVNENTFGAGIQGQRQGYSGAQEAFLTGQEMRLIRPPRVQIQNAMAKISQKFFQMIDYLADDGVKYMGRNIIKPKDIVHPIWVGVSLDPIDRTKQQAEIITLKELWIAGAISWETFAIKTGIIDDIGQEKRLLMVNQILRDPELLRMLGQEALQEFSIAEKTRAMAEIRQQKGLPEGQGVYGMAANQGQVQDQMMLASQGQALPPQRANSVSMEDMNAY